MTVVYDLVATTGSYTNAQGEEKKRWEKVGAVHKGQYGPYITLEAWFNPAGLPRKDGDSRVYLNCYEPKPTVSSNTVQGEKPPAQKSGTSDMDGDIPF